MNATRRQFVRAGVFGALGLSLADHLRLTEASRAGTGKRTPDRQAVFINLGGGPSHLDTFDPKPDAPAGVRGEFGVTRARTGALFCEHLPRLAGCADRFTLLRSVTHNLGAHAPAGLFVNAGNRPLPSLLYPSYGAVVSKELPAPPDVPGHVGIPDGNGGGYLGVAYNAYSVGGDPSAPGFSVRSLSLPHGLSLARLERRQALVRELDTFDQGTERPELLDGLDRFARQALEIIRSPRTRSAFEVEREPEAVREWYGRHTFGQSLLLARRLLEARVRFVSVQFPATWDTHEKNFETLKARHLPWLDRGLSAFLLDLEQRGLLGQTVVFMTGEFGRTPRVNGAAGRDHWPHAFTMMFAGAGVRAGEVIGRTDAEGSAPADRPTTPEDVAATFYHLMGIDPRQEYRTPSGRPVAIVRDGKLIPELLA